jgi:hypothetical protein
LPPSVCRFLPLPPTGSISDPASVCMRSAGRSGRVRNKHHLQAPQLSTPSHHTRSSSGAVTSHLHQHRPSAFRVQRQRRNHRLLRLTWRDAGAACENGAYSFPSCRGHAFHLPHFLNHSVASSCSRLYSQRAERQALQV